MCFFPYNDLLSCTESYVLRSHFVVSLLFLDFDQNFDPIVRVQLVLTELGNMLPPPLLERVHNAEDFLYVIGFATLIHHYVVIFVCVCVCSLVFVVFSFSSFHASC